IVKFEAINPYRFFCNPKRQRGNPICLRDAKSKKNRRRSAATTWHPCRPGKLRADRAPSLALGITEKRYQNRYKPFRTSNIQFSTGTSQQSGQACCANGHDRATTLACCQNSAGGI